MSNVIIGIIASVLFIGLALAGGIIYGSDFLSASSESRASAYGAALAQTAHAANLYYSKTGSPPAASQFDAQAVPRYIKSRPTVAETQVSLRDAGNSLTASPAAFAEFVFPAASITPALRNVCAAYETDLGSQTTTPPTADVAPDRQTGCFVSSQAWGDDAAGTMYLYYRI